MEYSFRYQQGDSTVTDEAGNLIVDDIDTEDCIPLESLCTLSIYREAERNGASAIVPEAKSNQVKVVTLFTHCRHDGGTYRTI